MSESTNQSSWLLGTQGWGARRLGQGLTNPRKPLGSRARLWGPVGQEKRKKSRERYTPPRSPSRWGIQRLTWRPRNRSRSPVPHRVSHPKVEYTAHSPHSSSRYESYVAHSPGSAAHNQTRNPTLSTYQGTPSSTRPYPPPSHATPTKVGCGTTTTPNSTWRCSPEHNPSMDWKDGRHHINHPTRNARNTNSHGSTDVPDKPASPTCAAGKSRTSPPKLSTKPTHYHPFPHPTRTHHTACSHSLHWHSTIS